MGNCCDKEKTEKTEIQGPFKELIRKWKLGEEQIAQIKLWSKLTKGQFADCGTLSVSILGETRRLLENLPPKKRKKIDWTLFRKWEREAEMRYESQKEGERAADSLIALQTKKRKQELDDIQPPPISRPPPYRAAAADTEEGEVRPALGDGGSAGQLQEKEEVEMEGESSDEDKSEEGGKLKWRVRVRMRIRVKKGNTEKENKLQTAQYMFYHSQSNNQPSRNSSWNQQQEREGRMRTADRCRICGQRGHWASSCPNNSPLQQRHPQQRYPQQQQQQNHPQHESYQARKQNYREQRASSFHPPPPTPYRTA